MKRLLLLLIIIIFSISSCEKEPLNEYKTKNVIIIVMDGPRYSETWGDSTHKYIPHLANDLAPEGTTYTQFYTNGVTKTNPGHAAITTGVYQALNNNGDEIPKYPSIFQHWIRSGNNHPEKAWIVTSKDKLEVLADCQISGWNGFFGPSTDCGVSGLHSEYRSDSITFENTMEVLEKKQPELMLINFREPDYAGHGGSWKEYIKGIRQSDEYIYQIWKYLYSSPHYKDNTTLFVTNDHGRHLDGISVGFVGHGDDCEGCRHINLFACGPDFKKGVITDTPRELIDIPLTIGKLLHFEIPHAQGVVMEELFLER